MATLADLPIANNFNDERDFVLISSNGEIKKAKSSKIIGTDADIQAVNHTPIYDYELDFETTLI